MNIDGKGNERVGEETRGRAVVKFTRHEGHEVRILDEGSDTGEFFALDARNGKELFTTTVRRSIRASPLTYRANSKQYVAFVASNRIHAYGLR